MQDLYRDQTAERRRILQPPEEDYNLDEAIEAISKCINRPHMLDRLCYFTLKHIRLYFYCDNIKSATANDVVSEVITKVLAGKRKWDKNKFPQIDNFLRMAILSYIRNEAKRKDIVSKSETINNDEYDWEGDPGYYRKCIEEDFRNKLFAAESNLLIENFIGNFNKDELAVKILRLALAGIDQQTEIAKHLNIDIKEVYKAFKRIRRKKKRAEQLFF